MTSQVHRPSMEVFYSCQSGNLTTLWPGYIWASFAEEVIGWLKPIFQFSMILPQKLNLRTHFCTVGWTKVSLKWWKSGELPQSNLGHNQPTTEGLSTSPSHLPSHARVIQSWNPTKHPFSRQVFHLPKPVNNNLFPPLRFQSCSKVEMHTLPLELILSKVDK